MGYHTPEEIGNSFNELINKLEPKMGNESEPPIWKEVIKNSQIIIKYEFASLRNRKEKQTFKFKYLNNLLLLGLYLGVSRTLTANKVPNSPNSSEKINKLKERFNRIYSKIFGKDNINSILLEKDIKNLENWLREPQNGTIDLRNFFAHSGLLTQLLQIIDKSKGNITVRYKPTEEKKIKEFLEKLYT